MLGSLTSLSIYNMKKILIINSGSSSIKFQLIRMPSEEVVAKGIVDAIGTGHSSFVLKSNQLDVEEMIAVSNHRDGLHYMIDSLLRYQVVTDYEEIKGCGHRVAHGGEHFQESVVINEKEESVISKLGVLAPLHNPMNLLGYQILKTILPNAKHVAVFDTSFHQTMKEDTFLYSIPYGYYTEDHIRKYGFHGTSCKYISLKVKEHLGEEKARNVIICHLGNGASVTAVKNGKSIDTSMGLTPLGGIPMGSRCGDMDPSIVAYISELKHKTVAEVLAELNQRSGLLGLSGKTFDMRILCKDMERGDRRAKLAIDVYVKRIVDYIGSYYLHLGGLDSLVFTGGIGENSSEIRRRVAEKIREPLGVRLSPRKNNQCKKDFEIISDADSGICVCVIKTNEEVMIARDTHDLILT